MATPRRNARSLQQLLANARRAGWAHWIRGAADERALLNGCYFDLAAAERIRDFFAELLVHSKGRKFAGQPFTLLDWQYRELLGPLFGWKRADGTRRFRRAYVEIPKKNGKSTLASGVSLYLLLADGEPGAEIYSCATDRDQAGIVYGEAANMVEASPELLQVLKVRRSTRRILYEETRSWYEAISADADSSEGKNAHGIIADELHVWRGRGFFDSLVYSGASRDQPLFFMITTAGDDRTGVCYEEHERAQRILRGEEFADEYFAYIRAADPRADWKAERTWRAANPSFGVTLNAEDFAADCRDAAGSPTKEHRFKRYRLNLWVGASEAWLSADVWDAAAEDADFEPADLAGGEAYGGIDLSRTRDITAVVWLVWLDGVLHLVPRFYMPEGLLLAREREDKVPYRAWARAKLLTATPGNVVDYSVIREDVKRAADEFLVCEIGYDPYNAEHLCNQLLGLEDGLPTVEVRQSMQNMGPATTEFEKRLKDRTLRHPNHPVLNWMAGNTVVYEDTNGNIRPVKRRSTGRIDGITAAIIALGRVLAGAGPAGSYYDDHDVELL